MNNKSNNTMIKFNGKSICPEKIENQIINSLDYVKEVVVYPGEIKFQDKVKNVMCAGMYLESEEGVSEEDFIADISKLNKNLPKDEQIKYVDISFFEFDKTDSNKIKREIAIAHHSPTLGIVI